MDSDIGVFHQGDNKTNASLFCVEIFLGNAASGFESGQILSYSLTLKEIICEELCPLNKQREKLRRTPYAICPGSRK